MMAEAQQNTGSGPSAPGAEPQGADVDAERGAALGERNAALAELPATDAPQVFAETADLLRARESRPLAPPHRYPDGYYGSGG